ncbi:MAG: hypothetical protein Q4C21_02820 [Oscillospiraceae bacterium]|nr:hypothetical protein [Oscillospiraceae bacterium]
MGNITAKKVVLVLAALCVALALITTNNAATILVVRAQRNRNQTTAISGNNGNSQGNSQGGSQNNNGGSQDNNTPADNNGGSQDNNTPADNNQNNTPADNNGGNSGNNSTPADNNNKPADNNSGNSVQDIINYYKTAHNKATSSAKKVVLTNDGATNYNGVFEAGKLSSIGKSLVDQFMGMKQPNEEKSPSDLPPKGGIGALNAADVKSATKKDAGNYYEVTIVMKDDKDPVAGKGSGALVSVIETSQITGAISGVPGLSLNNISLQYYGSNITAKIEKSTGNMVYLKTDAPCVLSLDAKAPIVGSINGAQVGIECVSEYTISY